MAPRTDGEGESVSFAFSCGALSLSRGNCSRDISQSSLQEKRERERERKGERLCITALLNADFTFFTIPPSCLQGMKRDPTRNCVLRRWYTIQQCDKLGSGRRERREILRALQLLRVRSLSLYHFSQRSKSERKFCNDALRHWATRPFEITVDGRY